MNQNVSTKDFLTYLWLFYTHTKKKLIYCRALGQDQDPDPVPDVRIRSKMFGFDGILI
jgi:hypothetical protein